MALDISDIVMFRKRLGRASVAGSLFALIQIAMSVSYLQASDYGSALLYICMGVVGFALLLRLRKGSVAAAKVLPAAFALGLILAAREFAVRTANSSWNAKLASGAIAFSLFGTVAYFVVIGIDTVIKLEWRRSSESPILNKSLSSLRDWRDNSNASEARREIIFLDLSGRISETVVLGGAFLLLLAAVRQASGGGVGILSLFGFVCVLLGVNLRLRTKQREVTRIRRLLKDHPSSAVLLLRSIGDELLKLRSRISLKRSVTQYFSQLRLLRLIDDSLSPLGPVITCAAPGGNSSPDSALLVPTRLLQSCLRVMIVGRPQGLKDRSGTTTPFGLLHQGLLVFPPVYNSEAKDRWESFCSGIHDTSLIGAVPEEELGRAVLLLLRQNQHPVLITAGTRDEWTYMVAFEIAIWLLRGADSLESGRLLT